MADARVEPGPAKTWGDRLYQAAPVAPIWIGVGIAALLLLLFYATVVWSGEYARFMATDERWWQDRNLRLAILMALLIAAIPTARRYELVAARADLDALEQTFRWPAGRIAAARASLGSIASPRTGALSLLAVPFFALLVDRDPGLYFRSEYWSVAAVWTWLLGGLFAWSAALFTRQIALHGRVFSELASELPEIDLLDPVRLSPFGRQALRSALPGVIFLCFVALNLGDRGTLWALGVLGPLALATTTLVVVLPLRSANRRIRRAKAEEIARVNAAIRGETAALAGSPLRARGDSPSLADLIAYRELVTVVREWPFDAPLRARFLLYVSIPIGSWVGGALVERLLDAALG